MTEPQTSLTPLHPTTQQKVEAIYSLIGDAKTCTGEERIKTWNRISVLVGEFAESQHPGLRGFHERVNDLFIKHNVTSTQDQDNGKGIA